MLDHYARLALSSIFIMSVSCNGGPNGSATGDSNGGVAGDNDGGPGDAAVPEPVEPALPSGVTTVSGETLFSLDRQTPTVQGSLNGAPAGWQLTGQLESGGGMRSLALVTGSGTGTAESLAPSGWNLLLAGAMHSDSSLLACWNRLTGAESAPGAMPHPTTGLELVCRHRTGSGQLSAELPAVVDTAPTWLISVIVNATGGFDVTYYRNQAGWLFGSPPAGDGIYATHFDGTTFAAPALVEGP